MRSHLHAISLLFLLALVGCNTLRAPTENDLAAVRAAESFVVSYGYTDAAPTVPVDRLPVELWDGFMSMEELLAYRHDYLEPHAIGFIRLNENWLVVFKVTDRAVASGQDIFPFSPVGRHVFVGPDFKAGMMHSWADPSDPTMVRLR